jgi:hypothetical protein
MATPRTILVDHDVEGQVEEILSIWTSPNWIDLWQSLDFEVETFEGIGLPDDTQDVDVWHFCQAREMVLITGNRNARGANSLEQASQRLNQPTSLPVLTIADPNRVMIDRQYAERVASRILDYLFDIELVRGTLRLFVP